MNETRRNRIWEPMRCSGCRQKLLMATPLALRAGSCVEVKCPKCNAFTYLHGRPGVGPSSVEAVTTT